MAILLVSTSSTSAKFGLNLANKDDESSSSGKPEFRQSLDDVKVKFCQKKEEIIKKRMVELINLVVKMETKFDAIAGRVKEYYTNKAIPSGKVVTNYDALIADISAKKGIVDTKLATAQTNADSFVCTMDKPGKLLIQFKTDMQIVKKALHDYRTSIKNLIVAIRGVMGETQNDD